MAAIESASAGRRTFVEDCRPAGAGVSLRGKAVTAACGRSVLRVESASAWVEVQFVWEWEVRRENGAIRFDPIVDRG